MKYEGKLGELTYKRINPVDEKDGLKEHNAKHVYSKLSPNGSFSQNGVFRIAAIDKQKICLGL